MDETMLGSVPRLFQKFKAYLIDDYVGMQHMGRRRAIERCIATIDGILHAIKPGYTCDRLGIRAVTDDDIDDGNVDEDDDDGEERVNDVVVTTPIERANTDYDIRLLTREQKRIFARIISAVARSVGRELPDDLYARLGYEAATDDLGITTPHRDGHLFYVDGPGGTGKTFLFNCIVCYVSNEMHLDTVTVAWTGIAATLLIGGRTSHRIFRLPLNINRDTSVGWNNEEGASTYLKGAGIILWDEASMTVRYAVEAVDRYLRQLMGVHGVPMGGKCVVFGGDFRQVLPVIVGGHRTDIIDACLKSCELWNRFTKLRLTNNLRERRAHIAAADATVLGESGGDGSGGPEDDEGEDDGRQTIVPRHEALGDRTYGRWLLDLGEGKLPFAIVPPAATQVLPTDLIAIPQMFLCPSLEALLRFVFVDGNYGAENVGDKAILCPTNVMVDTVNDHILDLLGGDGRTYFSKDEMVMSEDEQERLGITEDFLNDMSVPGLPPHELRLKVGSVVMLLRNLDIDKGACNGTRMEVLHLGDFFIECRLLTGANAGLRLLLPRIKMRGQTRIFPQEIERFQFPVRLAYAMTINKAQGQTLERAGIYLSKPCFAHGQLYVAFSRVGRADNVRVFVNETSEQGGFRGGGNKIYTRNVVYHSVIDKTTAPNTGVVRPPRDVVEIDQLMPALQRTTDQAVPVVAVPASAPADQLRERNDADSLEDETVNETLADLLDDHADDLGYLHDVLLPHDIGRLPDPYVDESGADRPWEFAPVRSEKELLRRVSVLDRPGTSGFGLSRRRPLPTRRRGSSSSSSSS